MAVYIMTQRDNRYWLVGPFDSNEVAGDWNRLEANNPSDDPRWQTITLDDPNGAPIVLSPEAASMLAEQNAV